jgi:diguanylate cyclase
MTSSDPSETPPFSGFAPDQVKAIYAAGRVRTCRAGDVLFRRNEYGASMFMIETGEIELCFADGLAHKSLGEGEVFGELAFVTGRHLRTATARATTSCRLRVIDETAFSQLLETHPRLLVSLLRHTCGYLLASESRLIASLRQKNRELESTLDYLRRTREEVGYQELLANTDELTGLYNRRCLDRQLAKFIDRAHATGSGLALILIDADDFKSINDAHGHAAGDAVLKGIARVITECVRASDLPCRFGGDEFAVVLTDIEPAQALERAEAVRSRVDGMEPIPGDLEVTSSVSIGGAMLMHPGESPDQLFARADKELYRAKDLGRNRACWYRQAAAVNV